MVTGVRLDQCIRCHHPALTMNATPSMIVGMHVRLVHYVKQPITSHDDT